MCWDDLSTLLVGFLSGKQRIKFLVVWRGHTLEVRVLGYPKCPIFKEQSGVFSEAIFMQFNITHCQHCTETKSDLKIVALIQKSQKNGRVVLQSAAEASNRRAKD